MCIPIIVWMLAVWSTALFAGQVVTTVKKNTEQTKQARRDQANVDAGKKQQEIIRTLTLQRDELAKQYQHATKNIAQMQESLTRQLNDAHKKMAQVEEQKKHLTEQLKKIEQESSKTEKTLRTQAGQYGTLTQQLNEANKKVAHLEQQRQQFAMQLQKAEQEAKKVEKALRAQVEQLKHERSTLELNCNSTADSFKKECHKLREALSSEHKRMAQLSGECETLRKQILTEQDATKSLTTQLMGERAQHNKQRQTLEEQVVEHKKMLAELDQKRQDFANCCARLSEENKVLALQAKEQKEHFTHIQTEFENALRVAHEATSTLASERQDYTQHIALLSQKTSALESALTQQSQMANAMLSFLQTKLQNDQVLQDTESNKKNASDLLAALGGVMAVAANGSPELKNSQVTCQAPAAITAELEKAIRIEEKKKKREQRLAQSEAARISREKERQLYDQFLAERKKAREEAHMMRVAEYKKAREARAQARGNKPPKSLWGAIKG